MEGVYLYIRQNCYNQRGLVRDFLIHISFHTNQCPYCIFGHTIYTNILVLYVPLLNTIFPLVRDRQHFKRLASCFFRASVIARRGFRVGMSDDSRHRDNVHARGQRVTDECTA